MILIFSIVIFTIEQTTIYVKYKEITRVTISLKCIDFVKLSLIESMCTFFSFMSFDCAMIFFNIAFISSSMMLRNIYLNNSRKISSNSRRRNSISVFNICSITSTESDCFLIICASFLNLLIILTTSAELNLINFIFLYLTTHKFKLISIKISFIATSARRTLINFEIFVKNDFICQIHCIRIISVANIFYCEQNNFLLFSIF